MANGIDGKTHVSLDTAAKAVVAIIGMVAFVLTMKFTQESQNARIDALTAEVSGLKAELAEQRKDINAWKAATADLIFKQRGSRL